MDSGNKIFIFFHIDFVNRFQLPFPDDGKDRDRFSPKAENQFVVTVPPHLSSACLAQLVRAPH
jgi:hypothetical protein